MERQRSGTGIRSFRDLRVWQGGMELVTQVYRLTRNFPQHEIYGLTNQLRRAAVSIPSNIAEGYARESTREYLQFISIAQGSLAELETQIEIAVRLEYAVSDATVPLLAHCSSLGRQLYSLRDSLVRKQPPVSRLPTPDSR